jgi:hypothetical protein
MNKKKEEMTSIELQNTTQKTEDLATNPIKMGDKLKRLQFLSH